MNYDIQLSNFQVGETPDLYGDTTMIKQIFQNLISNAVKYSRYENAAIIKIKGWRDGAKTIYSVADNGIGFDMQDATKIFEIFHRLPETDSYEGHGVGLAIVKRLVNRHDGTIWVESKKGFGSTFYFSFPDE
jgi:light-regulated signal transduction histidine kinase (bacteriophytochrome)